MVCQGSFGYVIIFNEDVLEGKSKLLGGYCSGKYEILTALHDRAGNLENESLLGKNVPEGEIVCSLCGERLNHNNLLPDGTVLLCDFDYGMQHVLGNLKEQTYEELLLGNEWRKVHAGMKGDTSQNILCRKCSCANVVMK